MMVADHQHDIAARQHVAGLPRVAARLAVNDAPRPRQAGPVDLCRTAAADMDLGRVAADREHHSRLQQAHGLVAAQCGFDGQSVGIGRQVRVRQRTAIAMATVVLDQPQPQRTIGRRLQAPVQGGEHLVAVIDCRRPEAVDDLLPCQLGHIGRFGIKHRRIRPCHHGFGMGFARCGQVDVANLGHAPQHVIAAYCGRCRVGDRVIARRHLDDAGQCGGFRHAQLRQAFAEIGLGRCRHAVAALPEENHVQISGEDFLLAEITLHPVGDEHLLQLAAPGLVQREEHVARGLHGDGAGALGAFG